MEKILHRWGSDIRYCRYTRLSEYLNSIGIGIEEIKKKLIGPIIFHENFSYFKEVLPHSKIYVTLQIIGLSESGDMFEFIHNFNKFNNRNFIMLLFFR